MINTTTEYRASLKTANEYNVNNIFNSNVQHNKFLTLKQCLYRTITKQYICSNKNDTGHEEKITDHYYGQIIICKYCTQLWKKYFKQTVFYEQYINTALILINDIMDYS